MVALILYHWLARSGAHEGAIRREGHALAEIAVTSALGTAIVPTLLVLHNEWAIVIALGAATGTIELVGRYRDAPFLALCSYGAILYIAVNVAAAVSGLFLLQQLGASFIQETDPHKRVIYEVLIAGFGSLAFLRSSIFKLRLNDMDISVGPALLLDILLTAADRGVDRRRATDRARDVADAMKDVSFDKAISALPPFCFSLMQNLSVEEQSAISAQLEKVQKNIAIDPHAKSLLMGLLLMNFVGVGVLKEAVAKLLPYIKYDVAPKIEADASLIGKLVGEAKRGKEAASTPPASGQQTAARQPPERPAQGP